MAHYAFIDENNIVVEVIVGKDESDISENWEDHYSQFRPGLRCKRTSYNTKGNIHKLGGVPFRKNFAGIGYTYDESKDAFIPPKNNCHDEEFLNEITYLWECYNSQHNLI